MAPDKLIDRLLRAATDMILNAVEAMSSGEKAMTTSSVHAATGIAYPSIGLSKASSSGHHS
jgi:hypothetical protein